MFFFNLFILKEICKTLETDKDELMLTSLSQNTADGINSFE